MPIPKVGALEQPTFDDLGASNFSSLPLMMRLNYHQIHQIFSNSSLAHLVHTSLLEISDVIHAVLSVIPYNNPTIHNSSGFFMTQPLSTPSNFIDSVSQEIKEEVTTPSTDSKIKQGVPGV